MEPGETRVYVKHVTAADFAAFGDGLVHAVCSTFALAQAAEWAGRLCLLELKEEDEEGVGTFLQIKHIAPAFEGEAVIFTATLQACQGNEVSCTFVAHVGSGWWRKGKQVRK